MSRTEERVTWEFRSGRRFQFGPDAGSRSAEEVDGVPACDWGGVLTDERSRKSEPSSRLPVTTIDPSTDGDVLAQLGLQSARTVWVLPLDIFEGEQADTAKASEP